MQGPRHTISGASAFCGFLLHISPDSVRTLASRQLWGAKILLSVGAFEVHCAPRLVNKNGEGAGQFSVDHCVGAMIAPCAKAPVGYWGVPLNEWLHHAMFPRTRHGSIVQVDGRRHEFASRLRLTYMWKLHSVSSNKFPGLAIMSAWEVHNFRARVPALQLACSCDRNMQSRSASES